MSDYSDIPDSILFQALIDLHRKELDVFADKERKDRAARTARANKHAAIVNTMNSTSAAERSKMAWDIVNAEGP